MLEGNYRMSCWKAMLEGCIGKWFRKVTLEGCFGSQFVRVILDGYFEGNIGSLFWTVILEPWFDDVSCFFKCLFDPAFWTPFRMSFWRQTNAKGSISDAFGHDLGTLPKQNCKNVNCARVRARVLKSTFREHIDFTIFMFFLWMMLEAYFLEFVKEL